MWLLIFIPNNVSVISKYRCSIGFFSVLRKFNRKAICHLSAVIAKHDIEENKWPELFQFVQENLTSSEPVHSEVEARFKNIIQLVGMVTMKLFVVVDCNATARHTDDSMS